MARIRSAESGLNARFCTIGMLTARIVRRGAPSLIAQPPAALIAATTAASSVELVICTSAPWVPLFPTKSVGVPVILRWFARASTFCWAALTDAELRSLEELVHAEAGDALGDRRDHARRQPAGVLLALVVVEHLGEVEDLVLLGGGELGGLAA